MNLLQKLHYNFSTKATWASSSIERVRPILRAWYRLVIYIYKKTLWRHDTIVLRGSFITNKWSIMNSDLDITLFTDKMNNRLHTLGTKLFKIVVPHAFELETFDKNKTADLLTNHCLYNPELNKILMMNSPIPQVKESSFKREHFYFNKFFFSYFTTARTVRTDYEKSAKANISKLKRNICKIQRELSSLEAFLASKYSYNFDRRLLISKRLDNLDDYIKHTSIETSVSGVLPPPLQTDNGVLFETNFYLILSNARKIFTSVHRNTLYLPKNLFLHLYNIGVIDPLVIYRNLDSYPKPHANDLEDIWNVILYTWPYLKEEIAKE